MKIRSCFQGLVVALLLGGLTWADEHKTVPSADAKVVTWLGVSAAEAPPEILSRLPSPQPGALLVGYVSSNSPAAKAGLQVDDVLTRFGDQILINEQQLKALVASRKGGDVVVLAGFRHGKEFTWRTTLESKGLTATEVKAPNTSGPGGKGPSVVNMGDVSLREILPDGREQVGNGLPIGPPPNGADPLKSDANVARAAEVTVSSTHPGYSPKGAIDGVVGGFPVDNSQEWASNGEADGAEIRLTWTKEQVVNRVWLFDRPNSIDQITRGHLTFDDGSVIQIGALPDTAATGVEVRFPPKHIHWVTFTVDGAIPTTENVGLAEFAVFKPMMAKPATAPGQR